MPLEQLLQMYYSNNDDEKPEENNELAMKNDEDVLPIENDAGNPSAENSDPFLNQRVTRGCKWLILELNVWR